MPKYQLTLAYSVCYYGDCEIEAATPEEAMAKARDPDLDPGGWNSGNDPFDHRIVSLVDASDNYLIEDEEI